LHETRDWITRIEHESETFIRGGVSGEGEKGQSDYVGFPKNTGSCNMYAGCTYRDLCKFNARPNDILGNHAGFKVEHWEPFDILKVDQLGLPPENSND